MRPFPCVLALAVIQAGPAAALDAAGTVKQVQEQIRRADQPGQKKDEVLQAALDLATKALEEFPGLEAVRDYGVEWLADPEHAAPALPPGLLHVASVAYCSLVPSRSVLSQMGAAKKCGRLMERSAKVEPEFALGAPLRALAIFRVRAPGFVGGNVTDGVALAEKALALSPKFAPNQLTIAEVRLVDDGNRGAWADRLRAIDALADDAVPGFVEEQKRAKAEAKKKLEGK